MRRGWCGEGKLWQLRRLNIKWRFTPGITPLVSPTVKRFAGHVDSRAIRCIGGTRWYPEQCVEVWAITNSTRTMSTKDSEGLDEEHIDLNGELMIQCLL